MSGIVEGVFAKVGAILFVVLGAVPFALWVGGYLRRLEPPFAYRREARQLRSLLAQEQRAVVRLRQAIRSANLKALFRQARAIEAAKKRKRFVLADLGLQTCIPKAPDLPAQGDTSVA